MAEPGIGGVVVFESAVGAHEVSIHAAMLSPVNATSVSLWLRRARTSRRLGGLSSAAEGPGMNRRSIKDTIPRLVAAALFTFTGTQHFLKPEIFAAIVPPVLPAPALLVAISGAAEIAGALGLLLPQTRRIAVYGLIALLIAVFPANIYMAAAAEKFASFAPAWLLVARLPLQLVLIAWVWSLRPRLRTM